MSATVEKLPHRRSLPQKCHWWLSLEASPRRRSSSSPSVMAPRRCGVSASDESSASIQFLPFYSYLEDEIPPPAGASNARRGGNIFEGPEEEGKNGDAGRRGASLAGTGGHFPTASGSPDAAPPFTERPRARFDYTVTLYLASRVSARGGKGRDGGGAL